MSRPIDLLISGARVLTMDRLRRELTNASIAIDAGTILEIGPSQHVDAAYAPRRTIDGSDRVAMPGLVNAHNHLFQVMCRGLGDGADLSVWADRAIWPLASRFDEDTCAVAARLACIEMIESGTTTAVDSHYLHRHPRAQDGIAAACLESGLRAVLGRAAMDAPATPAGFAESPQQAVAATERFMADWQGKADRIVARPEAMNEVSASPELIRRLSRLAREAGAGFHMHAAETRGRAESLRQQTGHGTIGYLNSLGVLGPEVLLAHCVWLSQAEQVLLADTGTAVAHNPVSNQFLADGVAPIPQLLALGVRVGLGTDGAASNNALDMFETMKAAALLHSVHNLDAGALPAERVLALATIDGARAVGIGDVTGSLEAGKRADLLLLRLDEPRMVPCHAIVSNLVFSASSRAVDIVIIQGRIVAEHGRCITCDRAAVLADARALAELWRQPGSS